LEQLSHAVKNCDQTNLCDYFYFLLNNSFDFSTLLDYDFDYNGLDRS
jgi:hypothetical protein